MRRLRVCRLSLPIVAVVLSTAPAMADLWYEHYQKGEKALQEQNWEEAARQFTQAIEKKGDPGAGVRTYGMNFINYHPYFKLGTAYFHLGRFDAALQAFDSEERFGAIARSQDELAKLQTLRREAEAGQEATEVEKRDQVAGIVSAALDESLNLERSDRLDEAMAALGKGQAVDPNNPGIQTAIRRLRGKIAAVEAERSLRDRVSKGIEQARSLLAAGNYEEASSVLRQASSLRPGDAEIEALLAESQEKLRSEIIAKQDAQERSALVRSRLEAAAQLQKEGRPADALEQLQTVLAIEPGNDQALKLQGDLVKAQADLEGELLRGQQVQDLINEAERHFKAGDFQEALAGFNRALALDAENTTARDYVSRTFAAVSRTLLRSGGNLPPLIVKTNRTTATDPNGTPQEEVSSAEFSLSGSIFEQDTPLQIEYIEVSGGAPERIVHKADLAGGDRVAENLVMNTFSQRFSLRPGLNVLKIVVTDALGATASVSHQVEYHRPFLRTPAFYWALSVALVGLMGGAVGWRIRRRNLLFKRRFNPYIAGAPVLDDDLFCGRGALLSRILQTIHKNSILLYGERRIGKTSIQHHLKRRLQLVKDPNYEFYPVYVDLQGTPQDRFFATLTEDIFEELSPVLDGAKPSRDPTDGSQYEYRDCMRDIHTVLKILKKQSAKKTKLVLLIDEVDELNNYDPRINQKLRSLFMKSFAADLVTVVSGVGIKKRWESEGSPWYNFFEEIKVEPLTREEARDLIERPLQGVFKLDSEARERIIDTAECKPYLIQKICIALVNHMHDARRRRITASDVEAVGRPTEG